MRLRRPWLARCAALLLAGLLLAATAACGDDDDNGVNSADELREVEEVTTRVFGADPAAGEEAEFFFAHTTDNLIQTVLFAPSREECESSPVECIGEPAAVESVSGTSIDGDTAALTAVSSFGVFDIGLIRTEGVWMVDSLQAASDEVPEGAVSVDISLVDFAFGFDRGEIPGDGNFVFHATNLGQQTHEVVLWGAAPGEDVWAAIERVATEEEPPLAFKVFVRPGQVIDFSFDAPLEPGSYVLVCFFPDTDDPEFAPHIEKGMVAEFTVE